jgi:DNA-binding Lrp family transcriptional regulator
VDSKDFQLLVALYNNARQSYQSLGRLQEIDCRSSTTGVIIVTYITDGKIRTG